MGRRPLEENQASKRIIVRFGPSDYGMIRHEAAKRGQTISEFVRSVIQFYLTEGD